MMASTTSASSHLPPHPPFVHAHFSFKDSQSGPLSPPSPLPNEVRIHHDSEGEERRVDHVVSPTGLAVPSAGEKVEVLEKTPTFHSDLPSFPALHIENKGGVSPAYDWKLLPSRPLPIPPPSDGPPLRNPLRGQPLLNPTRTSFSSAETEPPPTAPSTVLSSPASAPPALLSSPSSAIPPPSSRPLSSSLPAMPPPPTRSESAPPPSTPFLQPSHPSRYSILGLPRPRRLAPLSPVIASTAAVFHPPPPQPLQLSPQSQVGGSSSSTSLRNKGGMGRKSWDLRDIWVNREQQEIRREEEKQHARIKQLTRALNLCRLFPPCPPLSEGEVEGMVKELKIDLSKLDVGHITTMEREEQMLSSPRTLLAVLQLLSSPSLSLSQVKERIASLSLSPEMSEYVIFFFVDAPATFDHASRTHSRQSHSRASLRHPILSTPSSSSRPPQQPRDMLSALTQYINRRQTEDRINVQQLERYAKHVGFDLAKVDLKEAQRVLGVSKEDELKEEEKREEKKEERGEGKVLKLPVELQSAKQVVIALQMFYEPTVYDEAHVLSICRNAKMPPETCEYLLRQNRAKRVAQQEEDRRVRRLKRQAGKGKVSRPTHWPVTVEDVSAMIANHRMCRGWINDEDELRELIRVTPLDLSQVSPVMLEGLLASDLPLSSPKQVISALSLLYMDISDVEVKAECVRQGLPATACTYILQNRVKWEELEVEELTGEDIAEEAVRQRMRKKASTIQVSQTKSRSAQMD